MKVIIAGPRDFLDEDVVAEAAEVSGFDITEVVWGCARGVDRLAKDWADANGIPNKPFPAYWTEYGGMAGRLRNSQMATYGEALIALWDGYSTGTGNMIKQATGRGLEVYIHGIRGYKSRRP